MRIPKEFTHKGKVWKVRNESNPEVDKGEVCDGLCDFNKRVIVLHSGLKGKKRQITFLHELFHVVVHEAHINPGVRFSGGIEEVLCDAFADLITTSFSSLKWKKRK